MRVDEVGENNSSEDDLVYHYTNAEGLIGIITSGQLWASDARFLNDAAETAFALPEVIRILQERLANEPEVSEAAEILPLAISMLNEKDRSYGAYVTCFCESGDLLSQWRGYGRRQGYAIGFDRSSISDLKFPDQGPDSTRLERVIYGLEPAREFLEHAIATMWPGTAGHSGTAAHYLIVWTLLPLLARIKHPSFREERESRLIITPDGMPEGNSSVQFRTSAFSLVPYLRLNYPFDAIRRIVIGPGPHLELNRLAVHQLLMSQSEPWHEISLDHSAAPYRS